MQRLPDIEIAVGGSQQHRGRRDLFRPDDAPQRQAAGLPGLPFVALRVVKPRIDRPGRNRVDKDAVRRCLLREDAGDADDAGLCGEAVARHATALAMDIAYTSPRAKPNLPYCNFDRLAALAAHADLGILTCRG